MRIYKKSAISFILLVLVIFISLIFFNQNTDFRSRASLTDNLSCPIQEEKPFAPSDVLVTGELNYPSVLNFSKNGIEKWILFTGGISSRIPQSFLASLPGHTVYPVSQEEIWFQESKSSSLTGWSTPQFSFNILPDTKVAFKNYSKYSEVFPSSFKTGCTSLPNGQCNVQINDPSAVVFNDAIYLYFSILENYRWYDGSQGNIVNGGPDTPLKQNRHSIGLAISNDGGKSWNFIDKVLLESGHMADLGDNKKEEVIGPWAPSAVLNPDNKSIDLYFHNALGTKQYVAHMDGGVSPTRIERLNKDDENYRVNLDVLYRGSNLEIYYNDEKFNIVKTTIKKINDFGLCPQKVVVPASTSSMWPTPNAYISSDGRTHLFFWEFQNPNYIHHWVQEKFGNPEETIAPAAIISQKSVPKANTAPIIVTSSLPVGQVYKQYNSEIIATDVNKDDNLELNISGLPAGIYKSNCEESKSGGQISCQISGFALKQGSYSVTVKISDGAGGVTSKNLSLQIKNPTNKGKKSL